MIKEDTRATAVKITSYKSDINPVSRLAET